MLKPVVGCLTAVAIAATAAACTAAVSVRGESACAWESPQSAAQQSAASSDTVVLIDDSASFWPKAGQRRSLPDDPVAIAATSLIRDFTAPGTHVVSLGTFDGSSTTVNWKLSDVPLPTPTGDDAEMAIQQRNVASCLADAVRSLATISPQAPGTDVMAALAAAGQQLQGASTASDQVVLVTDGLSNTGCLNLSDIPIQGKAPPAVLSSCPERAGLALLRSVSLRLVGVGFQAGQAPLSTAQQAWVESYWTGMCSALRVASPGSCVTPEEGSGIRESSIARLPDAPIVFPTVPKGPGNLPVPSDLLFAFDSYRLTALGEAYLGILVQEMKAHNRTIMKVIGHTDARGTVAYNLTLSRKRAETVSAYLAQHGFPGVTAIGVGEADPACSPEYSPSGSPIESCMAQDRRVQIIIGG